MVKATSKRSRAEVQKQLIEKGDEISKSLEEIVKQDTKANTRTKANVVKPMKNKFEKYIESLEQDSDTDDDVDMDPYNLKDAYYLKQNPSYINKKKVMVLTSRGISSLGRQLVKDIRLLLPHNKPESKLEKKDSYTSLNTLAELSGCNSVIFIEGRKGEMIIWMAKTPHGPTIKGRLTNVHTLNDSTFFGNCLLYSRPLLTFDNAFDSVPHLKLIKEVIIQVFGAPNNHPKAKPFCDHCLSFFYFDDHIFFRHYQIAPENGLPLNKPDEQVLTEIGPQFVIEPILILNGSFNGSVLWKNKNYMSPVMIRRYKREMEAMRRQKQAKDKMNKMSLEDLPEDELSHHNVFKAPS
ncbi:ribosome biogenesis protein BRX1 [Babesia gibsoni]|uniref:Ribosome biogenesis protein BRX1 n=1 Tax=Babesia gibsoni TaxID=33632 RepID=A0AAD8LQI9_BABGI|nr:ribosome biogenesis protein BRX1 [Babesia gibsoni]